MYDYVLKYFSYTCSSVSFMYGRDFLYIYECNNIWYAFENIILPNILELSWSPLLKLEKLIYVQNKSKVFQTCYDSICH